MLYSSHYYACYYTLLCLLHQQQQAAFSLTIIIDGATTNEWATRDEYQRLIENSAAKGTQQQQQQSQQSGEQQATERDAAPEAAGQQAGAPLSAALPPDELDSALNQLDLLEQLGPQQQPQELQPPVGVFQALQTHKNRFHHGTEAQAATNERLSRLRLTGEPAAGWQAGARSFSDLAPSGDSHQLAAVRTGAGDRSLLDGFMDGTYGDYYPQLSPQLSGLADYKSRPRLIERDSAPKKYCGTQLMEILDLVCQSRFYSGNSEPIFVDPTIKSKRFVPNHQHNHQYQYHHHNHLPHYAPSATKQVALKQAVSSKQPNSLAAPRKLTSVGGSSSSSSSSSASASSSPSSPSSSRRRNRALLSSSSPSPSPLSVSGGEDGDAAANGEDWNVKASEVADDSTAIIDGQQYNGDLTAATENIQQPLKTNLNTQQQQQPHYGRNNKHSRMALYRRIRGAVKDCCERPCQMEELKPYCELK